MEGERILARHESRTHRVDAHALADDISSCAMDLNDCLVLLATASSRVVVAMVVVSVFVSVVTVSVGFMVVAV